MRRQITFSATVVALGVVLLGRSVRAEVRPFVVMLANSPKSFENSQGFPVDGLTPVENIREAYFGTQDSFAEYWEEISYGDVDITGRVADWVNVPWAFRPTLPNAEVRPSPVDYHSLTPGGYAYGEGEPFRDGAAQPGDTIELSNSSSTGALVIRDRTGNDDLADPPTREAGFSDTAVTGGVPVWTPGERFLDVDQDNRWDGLDEKNDMMCWHPLGCSSTLCNLTREACVNNATCTKACSLSRTYCTQNSNCPAGETCVSQTCSINGGAPAGYAGCKTPGCGNLAMPCIDWDESDSCENVPGCVIPITRQAHPATGVRACVNDANCSRPDGYTGPLCISGYCVPENCAVPLTGGPPTLPACCTGEEGDPPDCIDTATALPGINCQLQGVPIIVCCEFDDSNGDGALASVEPFEDFMVRWEPGQNQYSSWVKVTPAYILANYPGDAYKLIARTGNGIYDSPDMFEDIDSTKMQHVGNQLDLHIPKPGTRYSSGPPTYETAWFDSWWQERYGTSSAPPSWQSGDNSPIVIEFDPASPTPDGLYGEDTPPRRRFRPDAGGWNGYGRGSDQGQGEHRIQYDLGFDFDLPYRILPEESFGYYDGWVEHDDLASSIYHTQGDKRFGEITSPFLDVHPAVGTANGDVFTDVPAISGQDRGPHNPVSIGAPDGYGVAAGPRAVNIHGDKGFDAGDLAIIELMTWRNEGNRCDDPQRTPCLTDSDCPGSTYQCINQRTVTSDWSAENMGRLHPYANTGFRRRPTGPTSAHPMGFADYNLDGLIDQGEVRPARSANYTTDSYAGTPDDGVHTIYPFNRTRLQEDVVEALDNSVDWDELVGPDDFVSPANQNWIGAVSGVILIPFGSGAGFDGIAPSFQTITNRDNGAQSGFQNLVLELGQSKEFEVAPDFARTTTSAHEYLHAWYSYPDLYDYDQKRPDTRPDENCPVGGFDIMAGGGLVHPIAPLKEQWSHWVASVDLRTVLTPGVETKLTLPPAEFVRDDAYYYLENAENPGERYYFWSAGLGFDRQFPGEGLFILATKDLDRFDPSNPEAVAQQQRSAPYAFRVVQADGRGDLEACSAGGNTGDGGDLWPGESNNVTFGFETDPPATWDTQNRWTGLNITNIEPDGSGSTTVTLSWTPTDIPSLQFTVPPGGETVHSIFQVRFMATDVFGGTTIELYRTTDPNNLTTSPSNLIGSMPKVAPGTVPISMDWDIRGLTDGRYFLFAKLIPGRGQDGILEKSATAPRAGRNNEGNGTLTVYDVDISTAANAKARSETWTATCIEDDGSEWIVQSSLTQPEPDEPIPGPYAHAFTCPRIVTNCSPYHYHSLGNEVTFFIKEGSEPFTTGDTFNFTTAGITAPSAAVEIIDGAIKLSPRAVIHAEPLTIRPGQSVNFDATGSTDPQNLPLTFTWSFGDNSTGSGPIVQHAYTQAGTWTVTLRATNGEGKFGEAKVDVIVFNNSPSAVIEATTTSGPAPLSVTFSAVKSSDTETPASGLTFQWDLGDGNTKNDQGEVGTRFQTIEHTFTTRADGTTCTPGDQCIFTVQLKVTDNGGKSDVATMKILVGNTVPVANVTVSPLVGPADLEVVFNAIASTDGDHDPLTVDWDFGDGGVKENHPITGDTGETSGDVHHTYTTPGSYFPKAKVRDNHGGVAVWEGPEIEVTEPLPHNDPPTAVFTVLPADRRALPGESFTFDASGSTDPQTDQTLVYRWAFGDGSFGTGKIVTHAYNRTGDFQVQLTVTDDRDASHSITKTVTVYPPVNRPPVAVIATGPRRGTAPALLSFDGRNSHDPDGDTLEYTWEFRQGSTLLETMVGSVVSRVFQDPGTYTVVLEVDDGREGGVDRTDPIEVVITAAGTDNGGGTGDDDEGHGIPDSADQRPTPQAFCGLGMLSGLLGSILGLGLMAVTRGRRRR